MKADLLSKLTILSSSLVFLILQPLSAVAQGNCAMEQHVVDSWTATVQADQDAIQRQSQGSRGLKLDESQSLNERLERDTKRMQQAQTRLAECQKKTSNSPSPAAGTQQHSAASARPISLSRTTEAQWKIDGFGTLTLGQADPQSRTIAGVLLVQTDSLQGIPKDTKLTMKGPMHVTGFKLQGSKLTKGNYLNIVKKKEDIAYEYRLTLEAQLKDPKTAAQLNGTATLMKFERYIADKKGTRLGSFAVTGPYTPGDLGSCEMPVAEAEVFDPSNRATSQKYLDRYHQALAQTNGKTVLSDADVASSAKALLPFLRYAAAHQDNPAQKTKPAPQNNPALADVTGLLGPSSLVTLRTQLQNTATVARVGGIAETTEVTEAGGALAMQLAEDGIIFEEIPGGQLVGLGVLGIAAIAEGVYLWEKAHAPSTSISRTEKCTSNEDGVVVAYRGLKGNNPGELRIDADGLSTFEVLQKQYPCIIGFVVKYRPPKEPELTVGAVSTVASSFATVPWSGAARFTPQFDVPGIGINHWSINGNLEVLKPELKRLCPNSVFKLKPVVPH